MTKSLENKKPIRFASFSSDGFELSDSFSLPVLYKRGLVVNIADGGSVEFEFLSSDKVSVSLADKEDGKDLKVSVSYREGHTMPTFLGHDDFIDLVEDSSIWMTFAIHLGRDSAMVMIAFWRRK